MIHNCPAVKNTTEKGNIHTESITFFPNITFTIVFSGGFKGVAPGVCPPTAQNFLNFMHFFLSVWQNHRLAHPPGGLASPPTGNPGSVPCF